MRVTARFLPQVRRLPAAVLALAVLAGSARADWVWECNPANLSPTNHARRPALLEANPNTDTAYMAWSELNGTAFNVYVKRQGGFNWSPVGGPLNNLISQSAGHPDLAMISGQPLAVFWEMSTTNVSQVYVKWFNGSSWMPRGGVLNERPVEHALAPRITVLSLTPHVCWQENSGTAYQVFTKHFNGSVWLRDGPGSLNMDPLRHARAPDIANDGALVWVAWSEEQMPGEAVWVKTWDGAVWSGPVGGAPLNQNISEKAQTPRIAWNLGAAYVAYAETVGNSRQVYVKCNPPASWGLLGGGSVNVAPGNDAYAPALAVSAGTPYVAWCEFDGNTPQVFVKRFRGGLWEQLGGSLNTSTLAGGFNPDLTVVDGTLFAAWEEFSAGVSWVCVKRWDEPTPTPTPTPPGTYTFTPTRTASVTVSRTPTPQATSTPSQSPTISRTCTQSPTPPGTYTATPTCTPTQAPSQTGTPRLRLPTAAERVIVRGNVYRPAGDPPVVISVFLERAQNVKVAIYTQTGKLVAIVAERQAGAGTFEAVWEGLNREGRLVRSGVYLVMVETETFREKRRLAVIR